MRRACLPCSTSRQTTISLSRIRLNINNLYDQGLRVALLGLSHGRSCPWSASSGGTGLGRTRRGCLESTLQIADTTSAHSTDKGMCIPNTPQYSLWQAKR